MIRIAIQELCSNFVDKLCSMHYFWFIENIFDVIIALIVQLELKSRRKSHDLANATNTTCTQNEISLNKITAS